MDKKEIDKSQKKGDPNAVFGENSPVFFDNLEKGKQFEPNFGNWLSTKLAAVYISSTEKSIRNMVYRRQIPFYKLGKKLLIKRSDLDRLIESSRKGGFQW